MNKILVIRNNTAVKKISQVSFQPFLGGAGVREVSINVFGPYFTNNSQEHSLTFFFKKCEFESNTTSDWLNRMV